jgi:hypothetical protein
MWECRHCSEVHDQQFEACWSCGLTRDELSTEVVQVMTAAAELPGHSEPLLPLGEARSSAQRWGSVLCVTGGLLLGAGFSLAGLFAFLTLDTFQHGWDWWPTAVAAAAMLGLALLGRQMNRAGRIRNPNIRFRDWVVGLLALAIVGPLAFLALMVAILLVGLGGVK